MFRFAQHDSDDVRNRLLRPGDQTQFMHLHQAGMCRHDTHAKAISAAFRRGDRSLINIIAVAICAAGLIEEGRRGISDVAVVNFTMVRLHAHVLWIDRSEMNARRNLQRFADQNALSIFVSDLDIRNLHCGPILAYLRFPLAHVCGGAAAVAGKILVRFRSRDIELLSVFLHHPLRVKGRRDASD